MLRSLRRLLLVTVLVTGVGVAAEATAAVANAPADHVSAPQQKDKKKRKKATVKLGTTDVGRILVDTKGRTLYAFDPDGTDTSASKCTGACSQTWPPLTASGTPKASKGLDTTLLTIGGGGQVAYNGHLLYRYSADTAAGDTNGQGVGGIWHVVDADGNPIA
jgi:predicted lipoprotein with Yx(FWY)xxD motif